MSSAHAPAVAKLHLSSIKTGLIASLGQRFCERLYWAMANTPHSFVLVYKDDAERVLGFVCGATNTSKMYRSVVRRHLVPLALSAFGKIIRPAVLSRALTTLKRPKQFMEGDFAEWNLPEAELVSIGVCPTAQGKRIGTKLVDALFARMDELGHQRCRVWTSGDNLRAKAFYEKRGFTYLGVRQHHSGAIHVLVADLRVPRGDAKTVIVTPGSRGTPDRA